MRFFDSIHWIVSSEFVGNAWHCLFDREISESECFLSYSRPTCKNLILCRPALPLKACIIFEKFEKIVKLWVRALQWRVFIKCFQWKVFIELMTANIQSNCCQTLAVKANLCPFKKYSKIRSRTEAVENVGRQWRPLAGKKCSWVIICYHCGRDQADRGFQCEMCSSAKAKVMLNSSNEVLCEPLFRESSIKQLPEKSGAFLTTCF